MNDDPGADRPEEPGIRTLPRAVREAEARYIEIRRGESGQPPDRAPIGLALSGGGIRAATFSLGIFQSLARNGFLRTVDYLSTVSGGGYMGAALSSLLSRASGAAAVPVDPPDAYEWIGQTQGEYTTDPAGGSMPFLTRRIVHYLRSHGDYLVPRRGLLGRDFLRMVGNVLTGLLLSLGLFAAGALTTAALYTWLLVLVEGSNQGGLLDKLGDAPALVSHLGPSLWPALGSGLVLGLLLLAVAKIVERVKRKSPPDSRDWRVPTASAWISIVFSTAVLLLAVRGSQPRLGVQPGAFCFPVLLLAVALGVLLLGYAVLASFTHAWGERFRSMAGAVQGTVLMVGLGWLVLAVTPWLVWKFSGIQWQALGSGLASAILARLAAPRAATGAAARREGGKPWWRWGLNLAVALLLIVVFTAATWLVLHATVGGDNLVQMHRLVWWIAIPFVCWIVLGFFDFNRISPHYFYRDRLADTFLRTESGGGEKSRTVRDDRELPLDWLHGRTAPPHKMGRKDIVELAEGYGDRAAYEEEDWALASSGAPYHLVMCALNLAGSRDLARRDRKSDVFVFSRLFCGSSTTGYVPTHVYREGKTSLATAMAVSGAAVSSGMGYMTSFAQSFATTLFNLRLGVWMTNPRIYDNLTVYPEHRGNPKGVRAFWKLRFGNPENLRFWPLNLAWEMFGLTSAQKPVVNLSDGGHTGDNLGIYPLLQRRCALIVAADASADRNSMFEPLAEAIRQIYVDENIRIDIDLAPLRPDPKTGHSREHWARGTIHYPEVVEADGTRTPASRGVLVYLKASITGTEPTAVESYRAKNPDFPHQSTGDQFFDDAQFEAYRELGETVGDCLGEAAGSTPPRV